MLKRFLPLTVCTTLVSCSVVPATVPHQMTEQLGQRHIEYVIEGTGTPTVVFENGLDGTLGWWSKVLPEVAKQSTAIAYNRPGYGQSSAASTPRDGLHVVEELRQFLRAKHLNPPYLLVGHSLGGLYLQLFTRLHPGEVSGLVLVDSTHPYSMRGAGAVELWPAWLKFIYPSITRKAAVDELALINQTGDEVMQLPLPQGVPMTVISALEPVNNNSALALDANAKRLDLQRMYPNARTVLVNGGHGIPQEHPEVVIAAIRELLPRH